MSNLQHINDYLVLCSSNFKSDEVIEFLDLENHKVDTNIRYLPPIKHEIAIRIQSFRHIGRHLVFWSSTVKSDDIIDFLDIEKHKVDTNNRWLDLIQLEI